MGGFLGGIFDSVFGEVDKSEKSGGFQNLGSLGSDYSKWLMDRMNTPTTELPEWAAGKGAIQDAVSAQGATARQRLGDAGVAGGFIDSGQIGRGNTDIARGEMTAFSSALRDLFMQLETSKTAGVLPYLTRGAAENASIENANLQGSIASRGQGMSFTSDLLRTLVG